MKHHSCLRFRYCLSALWVTVLFSSGCGLYDALPGEQSSTNLDSLLQTLEHRYSMVLVRARDSSFYMGDNTNNLSDAPYHKVTLTYDYWMDTAEVTQADYDTLMSAHYSVYKTKVGQWDPQFGRGGNYPVSGRTWYDAVLYCNARSAGNGFDPVYSYDSIIGVPGDSCLLVNVRFDSTKLGYRLPTEAEWEYACRAGTKTNFYWNSSTPDAYAWYSTNSTNQAHAAAQKFPNVFGLYDMIGNVGEWCNDWYAALGDTAVTDPYGPNYTCTYRVRRGGSWNDDPLYLGSPVRSYGYPYNCYSNVGFRVVQPEP